MKRKTGALERDAGPRTIDPARWFRISLALFCSLPSLLLWAGEEPPRWNLLNPFQKTLTRAEFQEPLDRVYSPTGVFQKFLVYEENHVTLFDDEQHQHRLYRVEFATEGGPRRTVKPLFKTPADLSKLKNPADQPLRGLRIALDPGHIGGEFARMEERLFKMTNGVPVQEAAANLMVARLLAPQLQQAGATVLFTKNDFKPVTDSKPEQFRPKATQLVRGEGAAPKADSLSINGLAQEAATLDTLHKRMEQEFYRNAEIRARAKLLNEKLRPDLTLCIHFNAIGDPEKPTPDNRLLVMIHGAYGVADLVTPHQKFELLWKLLEHSHTTELAAADCISRAMATGTNLPPEPKKVPGSYLAVNDNGFLYARNLIANRLFHGPVVYLESYYQNNPTTYARLAAGDYEGERTFDGKPYRSIFRDYANAVAKGVIEFYR